MKKRCLSQLGTEEKLVQLSRYPIEILCGGQPNIGEAKGSEKAHKMPPISVRYRRKIKGM